MEKDETKKDYIEDTSKYGEFVCTEFKWLSPKRQKYQAKRLEQVTKKQKESK